jgi:hypothetical protein
MTRQRPLRNASTALALLAVCAATAMAQTPPTGWPWGSGFERRHTAPTVTPVEPLPQADITATTGSGSSKPGQTQGSGQGNSTGGRGNASGGSGHGR